MGEGEREGRRGRGGGRGINFFAPPSLTQEVVICCTLLFESQEWC